MSLFYPLRQLRQRWLGTPSPRRQRRRRGRLAPPERRAIPPHVEVLEDRRLMSVLPPPVVFNSRGLLDNDLNAQTVDPGPSGHSPQVVIDPVNPSKLVTVYSTGRFLDVTFSGDGGETWSNLGFFTNLTDPRNPTDPNGYPFADSPSVTFDRNHNFYVVYSENDNDRVAGEGAIVFDKFNFFGSSPTSTILNHVLYKWDSYGIAVNPVIATDNNTPSYTDPTTGLTQTDTLSGKAVYVAWNQISQDPAIFPHIPPDNLNTIKVMGSGDGGKNWSPAEFANDDGNNIFLAPNQVNGYASPQITFTQGTEGVPISSLTDNVDPNTGQIIATAVTSTAHRFTDGQTVTIQGANQGAYDGAFPVNVTGANSFTYTISGQALSVRSITQTNGLVTVTVNGNLNIPNGTRVLVQGADQPEYDGVFPITLTGVNTFSYLIGGNPQSPATGAISVTALPDSPATGVISATSDPGGQMVLLFNNFNAVPGITDPLVIDRSQPDGGTAAGRAVDAVDAVGPGGGVGDAIKGVNGPDLPVTTSFQVGIDMNSFDPNGNFSFVNDLSVKVALQHPHMNQVQIQLTGPTHGGGMATIDLLTNRTDAAGADHTPTGVPDAPNLGVISTGIFDTPVPTVFTTHSTRNVNDPGIKAGFTADFLPEFGQSLSVFDGLTRAELQGSTWTLSITDYRNDNPPKQALLGWELDFSSHISTSGFGPDTGIPVVTVTPNPFTGAPVPTGIVKGSPIMSYPTATNISPRGIGPTPVITADRTLGSFSPYEGRVYLAYVGRGVNPGDIADVFLIYTDDIQDPNPVWSSPIRVNDDTIQDGFSEGNRPQLLPELAVDPVTGTLVVSYFDARWDAAQARTADFIATSITGGTSFGVETFANAPKTAKDAVTGSTQLLEPIPDNQSTNAPVGPLGFGDRQGLAVYDGHVYPVWSGNLNLPTPPIAGPNPSIDSGILTATVSYAAGPRVVSSDEGPVVADGSTGTYNGSFTGDGTRMLDGFVVNFDRPIDPTTFGAGDITLVYRDTNTAANQPGTDISTQITGVTGINTDALPTLAIGSSLAREADGTITFTVVLNVPQLNDVTVDYTTTDGTAVAGIDYALTRGTITIPRGQTQATITIPLLDDMQAEGNQDFFVTITNASAGALINPAEATAIGTIVDSSLTPSLTAGGALVREGNAGVTDAQFTVYLSQASTQDVLVAYTTSDGTGKAGVDYKAVSGTLDFPPGVTQQVIDVPVLGNTLAQNNRSFFVNLSDSTGATIARPTGLGVIVDDDGVSITAGDVSVLEGNSGVTTATFNLYLNTQTTLPVTVRYSTADGTGKAGVDYQAVSGVVTFKPGQTVVPINVPVFTNTTAQPNRTFTINLSAPNNASIARAQGNATIVDDDEVPGITIGNAILRKPPTNQQGVMEFEVDLAYPVFQPVTVKYTTADDTATFEENDFTPTAGVLTFAPGQTFAKIDVPVLGDTVVEGNEDFFVQLTQPSANAFIERGQGTGTIIDDNVNITVGDVTGLETGNNGTKVNFDVFLDSPSEQTVTVDYTTSNGSAQAGLQYTAVSGTLTFSPGTVQLAVPVTLLSDTGNLPDTRFFLNLSNPVNGGIARATGTGTIVEPDAQNQVSVGDASGFEGNAGPQFLNFTVFISQTVNATTVVNYSTVNGTAVAGTDYQFTSGTVTIPANTSTATISVPILPNEVVEPNKTFAVVLFNPPSGIALPKPVGTGTIVNDDRLSINVGDVLVHDGASGGLAMVPVFLSNSSPTPVTATYTTVDGTATSPDNYISTSGPLVFLPGQDQATLFIPIVGDFRRDDVGTQFTVQLSSVSGAAVVPAPPIGKLTGTLLYTDDDGPNLTIGDTTVVQGNTTTNASFDVWLASPTNQLVVVDYTTLDGTGVDPADYVATTGRITFNPGDTHKVISVPVVGGTLPEPNRTFFVQLTDAFGGSLVRDTGMATIINQDNLPALSVSDAEVPEVDSGTTTATFTVQLSYPSPLPVTVAYSTQDDTAVAGTDYVATSGTLTFAPGQSSATFTVPVIGTAVVEGNRDFLVNLSTPTNATVARGTGTGTIIEDKITQVAEVSDTIVRMVQSGQTTAFFNVFLNAPASQPVLVRYDTSDGSATAGVDYVATSGTLTFAPGQTSAQVAVPVLALGQQAPDRTFHVNVLSVQGANPGDQQATGLIVNDNGVFGATSYLVSIAPQSAVGTYSYSIGPLVRDRHRTPNGLALTAGDTAVQENGTSTPNAVFTVFLSGPPAQPVTVQYTTADGSARAGTDYTATSGTLTFAPGQTTATVSVPVQDDLRFDPNESFFLELSNAQGALISRPVSSGLIIENKGAARNLTVNDVTTFEGAAGTPSSALFTVSLNRPVSAATVTVDYFTGDGSALAGQDYTPVRGTLTFNPGIATQQIVVPLHGNGLPEDNRTFFVNLDNPQLDGQTTRSLTLARPRGLGTIVDDDHAPAIEPTRVNLYAPDSSQLNLAVPPITGGNVTTSSLTLQDPTLVGSVIRDLTVNLTIQHPNPQDLIVKLIGPDGKTTVTLVAFPNPAVPGANFLNTTFDDQSPKLITQGLPPSGSPPVPPQGNPVEFRGQANPPYVGSFRPLTPLSALAGLNPNGTWTLQITDFHDLSDTGTLVSWSMRLQTGTPDGEGNVGDFMDQNQNAHTADQVRDPGDAWAIPDPTNGVPFQRPYTTDTLPLIVPGPHQVTLDTFTAPKDQINLRVPPLGTGGSGKPSQDVTVSTLNVTGLPANRTISRVTVTTDVFHQDDSDLTITLVAPDGTSVVLAQNRGNGGLSFRHTTFDDQALIPIGAQPVFNPATQSFQDLAAAPFSGTFIPDGQLSSFIGKDPNGVWKLEIADDAPGNTGTLLGWSLNIETALVLNGTANYIDVTFDRNIDPTSFTPDQVQRITGPAGAIYPNMQATSVTPALQIQQLAQSGGIATVTTTVAHGLTNNTLVTIAGADQAPYNGTYPITVTGPNTFTYVLPTIAVQSITQAGGTATVTTTLPHGLADGSMVLIAGASPGVYDGTFTIAVTGPNTFTYTVGGNPGPATGTITATPVPTSPATGPVIAYLTTPGMRTTVSTAIPNGLKVGDSITLSGAEQAPYDGTFTVSQILTPTTFQFVDSGNIQVQGITQANGIARVLTATPHGLKTGDTVTIFGANQAGYNGSYQITVTGPNTFTYVLNSNPTSPATGNLQAALAVTGTAVGNLAVKVPVSVTPNPLGTDPNPQYPRTYRISFPTQVLSGSYSVVFGPSIKSQNGDKLDTNLNAGVDILRGQVDPQNPQTAPVVFSSSGTTLILPGKTASLAITVPNNFVVATGTQVMLNITFPDDTKLEGTLLAPDGTQIPLFTKVGGQVTSPRANFQNTILVDQLPGNQAPPTPIQNAIAPFNGTFSPQTPLNALVGKASNGQYTLLIKNDSGNLSGVLTGWTLTLQQPLPSSGLGELNADQATASERIFTMDPDNALSHQVFAAVGPTSINDRNGFRNVGRISAIAVDPSDPSGNTVYVSGASGGVWRTTNFLTTSSDGPTYVPLTDFGPTVSLNIGSITVVGRNNDPRQSIVYAITGEGESQYAILPPSQQGTPPPTPSTTQSPDQGVGILRSMDGGVTWTLLDSLQNYETDANGNLVLDAAGNPIVIPEAQRDHWFVGTTGFKIVADPKPGPNGLPILYAAVGKGTTANHGGLYRSFDGGATWLRLDAGSPGDDATDVVLVPSSQDLNTGNLRVVWAAIVGPDGGVWLSSNQGQTFNRMDGGIGNALLRNGDNGLNLTVTTGNNPNPSGANGRIVLATPFATGQRGLDLYYQNWLYALVATPGGRLAGLFMTKDAGRNWVQVHIPVQTAFNGAFASNDENLPDYDPLGNPIEPSGNYNISLAIDPNNPNLVYIGGTSLFQPVPAGGLIRVDTTGIADTYSFTAFDNRNPDGGLLQPFTQGAMNVNNNDPPVPLPDFTYQLYQVDPVTAQRQLVSAFPTPYLNLSRDPNNPFISNATLIAHDTQPFNRGNGIGFTNSGEDIRTWTPFGAQLADGSIYPVNLVLGGTFQQPLGTTNIHQILTMVDPITGASRLILGDDQGVYTGVARGDGSIVTGIGTADTVIGNRNGDLQVAQLYYGAAQPSILAGQIAGALLYGTSQDNGSHDQSAADVLTNGNLDWTSPFENPLGTGTGVATDQTGSGTSYHYVWPSGLLPLNDPVTTNMYEVTPPGGAPISRTTGLILANNPSGGGPGTTPDPEWDFRGGSTFAVNPINNQQIVMSSSGAPGTGVGRIFRTTDQGLNWFVIGNPTDLDSTYAQAMAYGAPDPNAQAGAIDNFIYAGTVGGHIFVTFTGGGNGTANQWINISNGLDGSSVMAISADPVRGSHDAYAVTRTGVFYNPDVRTQNWQNITANLFGITFVPFGDPNLVENRLQFLTSLAVDWRDKIPDTLPAPGQPVPPNAPVHPALYVAGDGGVYRSRDNGIHWTIFPDTVPVTQTDADGLPGDGGIVPGGYLANALVTDLDLSVGNLDPQSGLPDQGYATNTLIVTTYGRGQFAINLNTEDPFNPVPGPRVTAVTPDFPVSAPPGLSKVLVTFSGTVNPATFNNNTVTLTGPNGPIGPLTLTDISTAGADGVDRHNLWQITFPTQTQYGNYNLTIGPAVTDFAGRPMDQDQDINLQQFPDDATGIDPADAFTTTLSIAGLQIVSVQPPSPVQSNPGLSSVTVTFNTAVNPATFDAKKVQLTGPNGAISPITVTDITQTVNGENLHNVWQLSFANQQVPGIYTLAVGENPDPTVTDPTKKWILDTFGNPMDQNENAVFGELPSGNNPGDEFVTTFAMPGVHIVSTTPGTAGPIVNPASLSSITVTFSGDIQGSTLTSANVALTGPGGQTIALSGAARNVSPAGQFNTWQFNFAPQNTPGVYTLTVGPGVLDVTGSKMDQNQNGILGEAPTPNNPEDQFVGKYVVQGLQVSSVSALAGTTTVALPSAVPLPAGPGLAALTVQFNMAVDPTTLTAANVTLTDPNGNPVALVLPPTEVSNGKNTAFKFAFASPLKTYGQYTLTVGPGVHDTAGNAMNQNGNAAFGDPGKAPAGDAFSTTFSVDGLQVTSVSPVTTSPIIGPNGLSSITVNLNMALDPTTFTAPGNVTLTDPTGNTIALTFTDLGVSSELHNVWRLDFAPQTTAGVYTLKVGPRVKDLAGNPMDQNENGTPGEATADQFTALFDVTGLQVASVTPAPGLATAPLSSFTLAFNQAADPTTLTAATVVLKDPRGNVVPLSFPPTEVSGGANTTFQFSFPNQTASGVYSLSVGPNVKDVAGNAMNQNGNAVFGEATDGYQTSFILPGVKVTSVSPDPTQPVLSPATLSSITVNFSGPVQASSLTAGGANPTVTLVGPSGQAVTGLTFADVSGGASTAFRITFPAQTTPGVYKLTVGPGVKDATGNPMDQNQNGTFGENPGDQFVANYVIDGLRVVQVNPQPSAVPLPVGLTALTVTFNSSVDPRSLTVNTPGATVVLTDPTGKPVTIQSVADVSGGKNSAFRILFAGLKTYGTYTLTVGPDVKDPAGNFMNQNGNTAYGESPGDAFTSTFAIGGLEVVSVSPPPSVAVSPSAGLSTITVTFNMGVSLTTFNGRNVQLFDPNGQLIPLTFVDVSGNALHNVWQLNFTAQTTQGNYTLAVGPGVTDIAGNPMDQNQNGTDGEQPTLTSPNDQYQAVFTVGTVVTPPGGGGGTTGGGGNTGGGGGTTSGGTTELTNQLTLLLGGVKPKKGSKIFTQTVTVFNTNNVPVQGLFSLVLDGLPRKKGQQVKLLNASGVTSTGSPFISTFLNAGQLSSFNGVTFTLKFLSKSGRRPRFNARLFEGTVF